MSTAAFRALVLAAALTFTACSDSGSTPLGPDDDPPIAAGELAPLLAAALQDEYHAEAVYDRVLADHGLVLPFANIVGAEVRHSQAILTLYAARGWEAPANDWTPLGVDGYASVAEACGVGVVAERANIALYDALLAGGGLPDDVVRVFGNNRRASLEGHLPAFERCAG